MVSNERDWEAENAADTMMRAEELKQKPALHKKAINILKDRQTALTQVINPDDGATVRKQRRGGHKAKPVNKPGIVF